jgi:hypothetical protein
MKHGVLKHWHPMLGCDRHIPWPPGSPAPSPTPVPYFTISSMMGINVTASMAHDVLSAYLGTTMLKVTDIGPMIPHIGAPSNLLLLEIPLSSSKSYFGSSRYVSKGKPVAVALLFVVNPNLNCGTPVPTPTGCVIAITTHRVDMSWGDIFAGLLQMCCDIAIMWAISKIGLRPGTKLYNSIAGRMVRAFSGKGLNAVEFVLALDSVIAAATRRGNIVTAIAVTLAVFLLGSPMGIDASTPGLYGKYSSDHPNLGADKGDHRGGPGDMAGGFFSGMAEDSGQTVGRYLDGGNPQGYPKDIGPRGITD